MYNGRAYGNASESPTGKYTSFVRWTAAAEVPTCILYILIYIYT